MCGNDKNLSDVIIEGAMLTVCENCAGYGTVVKVASVEQKQKKDVSKGTNNSLSRRDFAAYWVVVICCLKCSSPKSMEQLLPVPILITKEV